MDEIREEWHNLKTNFQHGNTGFKVIFEFVENVINYQQQGHTHSELPCQQQNGGEVVQRAEKEKKRFVWVFFALSMLLSWSIIGYSYYMIELPGFTIQKLMDNLEVAYWCFGVSLVGTLALATYAKKSKVDVKKQKLCIF